MKNAENPLSEGPWRRGLLGILWLPVLLIVDTYVAVSRGWQPASGGTFGRLPWLAVVIVAVALVTSVRPAGRRWLGRHAGRLGLFSVALAIALGAAEWMLALIRPSAPFHGRVPRARYSMNPNSFALPGVFDPALLTVNSLGQRGPEPAGKSGACRILCIGGSSTECVYLDDGETWPALLMKHLNDAGNGKYWVAAASVSEFATGHHVRFLRDSPAIKETDSVVIMPGANDFLRLLLGYDMGDEPPIWMQSNLMSLVREFWNARLRMGIYYDDTGEVHALRERGLAMPEREISLASALDDYSARLKELVNAAKESGVSIVLVTQPVLWDPFLTTLGNRRLRFARVYPFPRDWKFLAPDKLRDAFDQYNARLAAVAKETGAGFVDPAASMNGIEQYFYDDFHLSESGCARLAEILAEWFAKHPPCADGK
ncbi:MAG: SGNH/GDSL hydrolase family protein [Planctomycetota bacterium]